MVVLDGIEPPSPGLGPDAIPLSYSPIVKYGGTKRNQTALSGVSGTVAKSLSYSPAFEYGGI